MKWIWNRAGRAAVSVGVALLVWGCARNASAGSPRLVVNPYEGVDWGRVNQYKANLHTHTVESGGELFLNEVFKAYSDSGYAILAITDHDHCTRWQKAGIDPLKTYGILPVRGQEYSQGHHVCGLFLDHKSESRENGPLIDEIAGHGGVAVLNHPGRYWKPDAEGRLPQATRDDYLALVRRNPCVAGIEVFNKNDRYPRDVQLWDAVLAASMPDRPVWGFANDDMHERKQIGHSWETFVMDELTEGALRAALAKGCFTFSALVRGDHDGVYPPVVQSITHDPLAKTITVRAAADGRVLPDRSYRWVSGGNVIFEGPVFDYGRCAELGTYVRVELVGSGGQTYTNPFGFTRADP